MKRVLITGATGFIGRHCLLPLALSGYEVHALSSKTHHRNPDNIEWHVADLLKPDRASQIIDTIKPTHLLHFAWCTEPGAYWTSIDNLLWVRSSLTLLHAFLESGGQRAVMAGTCAEYDWRYGFCSEQVTPLEPRFLYGACKNSLQLILLTLAKQTGLSAAWGRIFFAYGPHEHPARLIPSIVRPLLKGDVAPCSHGSYIRDYLFVVDLANAFVALLNSLVTGPVNVASGRPVLLREMIEETARLLGRPELVQWGALPSQDDEPELLVADVRRLTREVGWQPQYGLQAGLARTIDWWRGREKDHGNESAA